MDLKSSIPVILALVLLFGCIQIPGLGKSPNSTAGNATVPIAPSVPSGNQTTEPACSPSYSTSSIKAANLSGTGALSVTASCATNKTVAVYVDGVFASQASVPSDPAVLNFNLIAATDGTSTVEAKADGASIGTATWTISPIGFTDTSGTDVDQISINHWKAIAFEAENPVTVRKVSAYMKRLDSLQFGSNIILEVRADSSGEPGSTVLAKSTFPMKNATLNYNWIDFPLSASLAKGKYWLVFSVDKDSDFIYINYFTVDKKKVGNADILKMDLVRNADTQNWDQTSWGKLTYDRRYAFMVSAND